MEQMISLFCSVQLSPASVSTGRGPVLVSSRPASTTAPRTQPAGTRQRGAAVSVHATPGLAVMSICPQERGHTCLLHVTGPQAALWVQRHMARRWLLTGWKQFQESARSQPRSAPPSGRTDSRGRLRMPGRAAGAWHRPRAPLLLLISLLLLLTVRG